VVNVVTFLWNNGYRNYKPEHVNMLANMVKHFSPDCGFICLTDETEGFNDKVQVVKLPDSAYRVAGIQAPQGKQFPSSYRRLWCFSDEAAMLGERILLLDLDCMVLNDLSPLFEIDSDFVGWKPDSVWGREDRLGGGTWLLRTGQLGWLWDKFTDEPARLIAETKAMGWNGSDQAILSRFLQTKYPIWPKGSGIYGVQDGVFQWDLPPKNAKVIHFNGDEKPWNQRKLWMKAICNHFSDASPEPK